MHISKIQRILRPIPWIGEIKGKNILMIDFCTILNTFRDTHITDFFEKLTRSIHVIR